jgi:hypothetical protein
MVSLLAGTNLILRASIPAFDISEQRLSLSFSTDHPRKLNMNTCRTTDAKQKSAKALPEVESQDQIRTLEHSFNDLGRHLPFRTDAVSILLIPSGGHLRPQSSEQHELAHSSSKASQETVERVAGYSDPVRHQENADHDEKSEEYVDQLDPNRCCLNVGFSKCGKGSRKGI